MQLQSRLAAAGTVEPELRFSMFQSINTAWDSSIVYEASASGDVQIFYSRSGQPADSIVERLASKYAKRFELMVATTDMMEAQTVQACGAEWISPEGLRALLGSNRKPL